MGDPRRLKKKFSGPMHPWQAERMAVESQIAKDYGLRRKNEIWKINSQLKRYFLQAKGLISASKITTDLEKDQFLGKLTGLGLLKAGSKVDDALTLSLKDLMERRLQTIVVRKKIAHSMKQARQFIVHEHIVVGNKKITVPAYMVSVEEESLVGLAPDSPYGKDGHAQIIASKEKAARVAANPPKERKVEMRRGDDRRRPRRPVRREQKR